MALGVCWNQLGPQELSHSLSRDSTHTQLPVGLVTSSQHSLPPHGVLCSSQSPVSPGLGQLAFFVNFYKESAL